MTKDELDKLEQVHKDIIEIKTVLLGVPNTSDNGLAGDVKRNHSEIKKLWITLAIVVGSVGGGAFGVIQLVG